MSVRIALDAMGGDHAPRVVIEGAMSAAVNNPDVQFILVGLPEAIREELVRLGADGSRFVIQPASQVVAMDEKPSQALRNKKDSSMRVGANMVKSGEAHAFVSAGNTGALMATAKFVLKTLPGIDRPAIASIVPAVVGGSTVMLDLGANVDCTAEHLVQFALMGEVYAKAVMGIENPRIGLLNIGEEEVKGNEVVKVAGERLRARASSNYIGNVEGNDIFLADVDVVVCDGFVGNACLKTGEGVVQMVTHFLKQAFSANLYTKLSYFLALPALKRLKTSMDPRRYNGAMLMGLNGVVVKSHGSADAFAFARAIQVAVELSSRGVNEKIRAEVMRKEAAA